MIKIKDTIKPIMLSLGLTLSVPTMAKLTEAEAVDLVKQAYIYGYPMVDNYRIQYSYFVDKKNPEYKGQWNTIHNTARVFTAKDTAIQAPNADTPYSFVGADLRTEPLVLSVPKIDKNRYYSIEFLDMHTYIFSYVGSRTTGNDAGNYLLVGPDWKGQTPPNIKKVIRSDTELAFLIYRTQLLNANDIKNVDNIQKQYKVTTLSKFLGQPAPKPAPAIDFIKPLTVEEQKSSPDFFNILNFTLQYADPDPSDQALLKKFEQIGVKAGQKFEYDKLDPVVKKAIPLGIKAAWQDLENLKVNYVEKGKISTAAGFGSREFVKNRLYLMMAVVFGIYGNAMEEAYYPVYFVDSNNQPINGKNNYEITFPAGQLPPVNAFWSLTLYTSPDMLFYDNPLNRYLINSPMEKDLVKNKDGSITLYIQNEEPAKHLKPNWLPAPKGPINLVLRLYWPKESVLKGSWIQPPLIKTSK